MKARRLIVTDYLIQAVFNGHYMCDICSNSDFNEYEMIDFLKNLDCALFLTDMELKCLNWKYGSNEVSASQSDIREMLKHSEGKIRYALQEGLRRLQQVVISKYRSENYYELVLTKNLGFSLSVYRLFGVERKYELYLDKFIHADIHRLVHIKSSNPNVYSQVDDILHSFGCEFEHDPRHYTSDELKEILYVNDLMPRNFYNLIARNLGEHVLLKDFLKYTKEEILQFDGMGNVTFQQLLSFLHNFDLYFDYEVHSFVNFKSEYEKLRAEIIGLEQQEREQINQIEKLFYSLDEFELKIKQKEQEIFDLQEEYEDNEEVKCFLLKKKDC